MSSCPYCKTSRIVISRETEPVCTECGLVVGGPDLVCYDMESYTEDRPTRNHEVYDSVVSYLARLGLYDIPDNIVNTLVEYACSIKKDLGFKTWDRAIAYTFFHKRKMYPMLSRTINDMATLFDIGTAEMVSILSRNTKLKKLEDDPVKRTVEVALTNKSSLVASREERVLLVRSIANTSINQLKNTENDVKGEMLVIANKIVRRLKDSIIFNNRSCAISAAVVKMATIKMGVKMSNSAIAKACGISSTGGMITLYERLASGEALE